MNDIALTLTDRLYLQVVPIDQDVAPLVAIQGRLRQSGITGRFADPSRLHMTIIHFGELAKVYQEVKSWHASVDERQFLHAASVLAAKWETLVPIEMRFMSTELGLFGEYGATIVLKGTVSDEIHRLHKQALVYLRDFFEEIGMEHVDAFMKGSINFRHALSLNPHITLIKGAKPPRMIQLDTFPVIECYNTPIVFSY